MSKLIRLRPETAERLGRHALPGERPRDTIDRVLRALEETTSDAAANRLSHESVESDGLDVASRRV